MQLAQLDTPVDAQTALAQIVTTMTRDFSEAIAATELKARPTLTLPKNTVGDIDFSVLAIANVAGVREISIPDGGITSIANLPESLRVLRIGKNKLASAPKLPANLETLHIGTTPITYIDLNEHVQLRDVCIARPHTDPNMNIVNNWPKGVVRIDHPGRPYIHQFAPEQASKGGASLLKNGARKLTVEEALSEYFRMQSSYDERNAAERRKLAATSRAQLRQWMPRCVNCRNIGGTTFAYARGEYSARCAATPQPCILDLRIAVGTFVDAAAVVRASVAEAEDIKTRIIRQRMDAVFGYVSEAGAATAFEKAYAEYVAATARLADTRLAIGEDTREGADALDRDVAELVAHVKDLFAQYYATGDRAALVEAVRVQTQDLAPAARMAVSARFPVVEMDTAPDGRETLMRHETALKTREINIGADPAVITWNL
jgi:hypothetical protein